MTDSKLPVSRVVRSPSTARRERPTEPARTASRSRRSSSARRIWSTMVPARGWTLRSVRAGLSTASSPDRPIWVEDADDPSRSGSRTTWCFGDSSLTTPVAEETTRRSWSYVRRTFGSRRPKRTGSTNRACSSAARAARSPNAPTSTRVGSWMRSVTRRLAATPATPASRSTIRTRSRHWTARRKAPAEDSTSRPALRAIHSPATTTSCAGCTRPGRSSPSTWRQVAMVPAGHAPRARSRSATPCSTPWQSGLGTTSDSGGRRTCSCSLPCRSGPACTRNCSSACCS